MKLVKKQTISTVLAALMLCPFVPFGANVTGANAASAVQMNAAAVTVVQKPQTNVAPGRYNGQQTVTLTAEQGAEIYYTVNNLMPTERDIKYTAPITVSEDTNICAIAVKDGVKSAPVTFGYLIRSEEPEMKFVVMSDIHVGDALSVAGGAADVYDLEKARVFKAMEVMSSVCPDPDLLVMNGDIIKHNSNRSDLPSKEADHAAFINLMKDSMAASGISQTPVQITIGNHDSEGNNVANMKAYYDKDSVAKDWFPNDKGYYHKELNGLDFIYLDSNSTASEQNTFLTTTLAEIQEKKGVNSPIFIFLHIPIKGALDDEAWTGHSDWKTILANYPQAIVFSGHTHYSISEDCSISQEAGFTAVNDGCMSYIERIDNNKEMMWKGADGQQKKAYQFPSTQGLTVEVYGDRVEINRITVNGDRGDAKANNYVPVEPFDNCGAIAGEKWVINRGETNNDWTNSFRYTKAQRKANAQVPEFEASAKPVLEGTEDTVTVSFPQANNAQKVDKYQIELVNTVTGKTDKTMKVWSENVVSPMPSSLTYTINDLAPEAEYRAKVTAYNDYGVASASIESENTYTTPALPGIKPAMLAAEDFTEALTDSNEDHARTVIPYVENYKSGGVMGEGEIVITGGESGTAKWVSKNLGGTNLMIPFQPGTTINAETKKHVPKILSGEFMFEMDLKRLSAVSGQKIGFYLRNGSINAAKLTVGSSNITYEYYYKNSSGKATLAGYASASVSGDAHKIRLLLGTDEENKQYLGGLWIDGKEITAKKQVIADYPSDGWKVIAAEPASKWVTGDMCSVDNIKVWRPTASQISDLITAGSDNISFEQIKGGNTDAGNVTEDLKLADMIGQMTASGLVILGWKSDNESVIAADGTVNQPAFSGDAATVTLTPVLGMIDALDEAAGDYVTADGNPITVTVPDKGMKPLDIVQTGYIANEDFTEALTDSNEDHARTVIPYVENYTSGGVMGEGEIVLTGGESGMAKWVSKNLGGTNLMIPFQPGTVINAETKKHVPQILSGEFMFEMDLKRLSAAAGQNIDFYLRNGNGTNAAKLRVGSSSISYEYYDTALKVYASASVSGDAHKIRLLLGTDEENRQYLGGLWIDGKEITAKKQIIASSSTEGWKVIAAGPASKWVTGDMCSVDNIKVWRSAEDQAKELAAAEEGKITFDRIKGNNESAQNVTEALELKSGETDGLQTENKLLVMGWKSDKPGIIDETGKVTRPAKGAEEVKLTPILAIRDAQNGGYVTVDGAPIIVTVKMKQAAFFDADLNEVISLNPSITQGIADISGFSGTVALYAALYNEGQLEQVWMSQTPAGGENATATVDIALPSDLSGRQLKLFVWDYGTLAPLCIPAGL